MRFIVYDFPDAARTPEFESDLYEACVELSKEYSRLTRKKITIDAEWRTDSPETMVVLCKKPKSRRRPQMLSRQEVMLTLEIATAIEEIAEELGIPIPDTEPVMQIH